MSAKCPIAYCNRAELFKAYLNWYIENKNHSNEADYWFGEICRIAKPVIHKAAWRFSNNGYLHNVAMDVEDIENEIKGEE